LDLQEFISSGILEAYVLGTATADEAEQVREMEQLHPEVAREIESIEAALVELAECETKAPSAALKNKIEQQLFSRPVAQTRDNTNNGAANVVSMNTPAGSRSSFLRYAVAASVALLIGSAILNYVLYDKLKNVQSDLAELQSEHSTLASQMDVQRTAFEQKDKELAMLMQPGVKMVTLKGMDLSPSSSAMVIWNTSDKSVYIDKAALPMPPQGKQYQLWALVDGKPVDAGVFTMQDGNFLMQKMKDMPNAQAFAVTLEKMGGSEVPTMEAMYLIGNV